MAPTLAPSALTKFDHLQRGVRVQRTEGLVGVKVRVLDDGRTPVLRLLQQPKARRTTCGCACRQEPNRNASRKVSQSVAGESAGGWRTGPSQESRPAATPRELGGGVPPMIQRSVRRPSATRRSADVTAHQSPSALEARHDCLRRVRYRQSDKFGIFVSHRLTGKAPISISQAPLARSQVGS